MKKLFLILPLLLVFVLPARAEQEGTLKLIKKIIELQQRVIKLQEDAILKFQKGSDTPRMESEMDEMAGTGASAKLSALTELATAPAESDELYINDGGTSKKITALNLMGALEAALTSFEIHADNLPATATEAATGDSATAFFDTGTLEVEFGGTELATITDGGVLLGSGTGPITPMAVLADGEFIVGDGTTDPVAESGDTARTSLGLGPDDDPSFNTVTITGGETASGGFEIDNMPKTDHTCQGILTTGVAGADNMEYGEIVTIANATGKWILANANSTGVLEARGIVCTQGVDTDIDDPILIMLTGYIRDDTWDFTGDINKDMLLDETDGDMVLADGAIPADPGDIIQIIGYVTMTSTMEVFYFNPQPVFSVLEKE